MAAYQKRGRVGTEINAILAAAFYDKALDTIALTFNGIGCESSFQLFLELCTLRPQNCVLKLQRRAHGGRPNPQVNKRISNVLTMGFTI